MSVGAGYRKPRRARRDIAAPSSENFAAAMSKVGSGAFRYPKSARRDRVPYRTERTLKLAPRGARRPFCGRQSWLWEPRWDTICSVSAHHLFTGGPASPEGPGSAAEITGSSAEITGSLPRAAETLPESCRTPPAHCRKLPLDFRSEILSAVQTFRNQEHIKK